MFSIEKDGSIKLTRGDTAYVDVLISNESTGEPYEFSINDTIRLTVKKTCSDEKPAFQKVVRGSNSITIRPEDTRGLKYGKYFYDVEITTASDEVFTVIGPNTFEIGKEVSF